ncbi:unnamed protein product [Ilex paraguariensis]|uniref:Uncharacterized protein n=1 Tax=Ilex paraguariensis TaxID=185542 RepID=A0ABC8SPM8_9AQUA
MRWYLMKRREQDSMAKKIRLLPLLLLLVASDLACATSRRKMTIEVKPPTMAMVTVAEEQVNGNDKVVAMSSAYDDPDVNNHHAIPRQSWDSSQNPNGQATGTQSQDGTSVNSHG